MFCGAEGMKKLQNDPQFVLASHNKDMLETRGKKRGIGSSEMY